MISLKIFRLGRVGQRGLIDFASGKAQLWFARDWPGSHCWDLTECYGNSIDWDCGVEVVNDYQFSSRVQGCADH